MDFADLTLCPTCSGVGHLWEINGGALRAERIAAGITGSEMARRIGLDPRELHDKETNRQNRRFTEDQARRYLAVLKGGG